MGALEKHEESSVDEKVRQLEEEVKQATNAIKSILTDVRAIVSELENPFNYIASFLEAPPPQGQESPPTGSEREAAKSDAEQLSPEKSTREKKEQLVLAAPRHSGSVENGLLTLVVAEYLYRIFGLDLSRKLLVMYAKRGWITESSSQLLLSILDDLPPPPDEPARRAIPVSPEDHVIALYLIKLVESGADQNLLPMLIALLKKIPGYDSPFYPLLRQFEKAGVRE